MRGVFFCGGGSNLHRPWMAILELSVAPLRE
jgi:hypothetical protein